jgi:hypothetical protein
MNCTDSQAYVSAASLHACHGVAATSYYRYGLCACNWQHNMQHALCGSLFSMSITPVITCYLCYGPQV